MDILSSIQRRTVAANKSLLVLFLPLTNSNKEANNEVKHSKVEMLCREVRAETWDVHIDIHVSGGLDSSRSPQFLSRRKPGSIELCNICSSSNTFKPWLCSWKFSEYNPDNRVTRTRKCRKRVLSRYRVPRTSSKLPVLFDAYICSFWGHI